MAGIPRSTIKTTVGLLVIGTLMVLALLIFASFLLGQMQPPTNDVEPTYPTPTPEIRYVPNPTETYPLPEQEGLEGLETIPLNPSPGDTNPGSPFN